ncbi:hypothetical protein [Pseudoxanthomonas indica]|uniref:Uncharacterized protein n=1 Tax=Pseudoxanthomonas indica TaxID=428993 RepID=A0A1T5KBT4_9GAMM|nr:hypothetical protein [Pseudoxanthomonas indica]SKC61080.1 hypothetical protein SAMN06296058_1550 [Pseudoxanthomonas indica]
MPVRSPSLPLSPALPMLFWLVLLATGAALLDLGVAVAWFGAQGVPAERVFQSIATWVMGRSAYFGGDATVVFGGLLYTAVLCGVMGLYRVLARRLPLLLARPITAGALYGALMYLLIFLVLVPHVSAANPAPHPLIWHALCVLAYALLVGIPAALLARLPAGGLPARA